MEHYSFSWSFIFAFVSAALARRPTLLVYRHLFLRTDQTTVKSLCEQAIKTWLWAFPWTFGRLCSIVTTESYTVET